jgi:hypothetical protein
MLMRDGFAFLDALHNQLADPSVFIVPPRTSKTRSLRSQQQQEHDGGGSPAKTREEALHERRSRLNILWALLTKPQDNKTLVGLVAEF